LMLNSQIAQIASPILAYTAGDAVETYAQSFGFQAYVLGGIPSTDWLYYTADNLFAGSNGIGYFQCAQDWATDLVANTTTPPPTAPDPYNGSPGFGPCDQVPAWYRQQLGH